MSLIRTTYLAAAAVLILGCSGPAQSAGLKVPWLDGASLGMGYDAKSGSLTGETCAKVQTTAEVSRNTSDFSFLRADSKDELITKMSGSIGGEAKFVAYGGSARASFASSLDIRRSDTTILVANEVTSEEVGSSLAEPVDRGDDLVKFRRRCGTHYVSTVVYGGELLMALQASEQTLDAKDEFEASVKGTVGAASGTAQFQQSKQRLESRKGLRITGRKAGGDGNQSSALGTTLGTPRRALRWRQARRYTTSQVRGNSGPISILLAPRAMHRLACVGRRVLSRPIPGPNVVRNGPGKLP